MSPAWVWQLVLPQQGVVSEHACSSAQPAPISDTMLWEAYTHPELKSLQLCCAAEHLTAGSPEPMIQLSDWSVFSWNPQYKTWCVMVRCTQACIVGSTARKEVHFVYSCAGYTEAGHYSTATHQPSVVCRTSREPCFLSDAARQMGWGVNRCSKTSGMGVMNKPSAPSASHQP